MFDQRLRKVQPSSRCRSRANRPRVYGLVPLFIDILGRTAQIRGQRHGALLLHHIVYVVVEHNHAFTRAPDFSRMVTAPPASKSILSPTWSFFAGRARTVASRARRLNTRNSTFPPVFRFPNKRAAMTRVLLATSRSFGRNQCPISANVVCSSCPDGALHTVIGTHRVVTQDIEQSRYQVHNPKNLRHHEAHIVSARPLCGSHPTTGCDMQAPNFG